MTNLILVGVDGSDTSLEAARTAATLAANSDSALHVLTAFNKDEAERVGTGADSWIVTTMGGAVETARSAADTLRSITTNIESSSFQGKPAEALIDEAKRLDARLIVVGNRRMRGASRVLGSVANYVSHNAPCDVYIVRTV